MKAQLLKINTQAEQSFSIRHDKVPVFHKKWHYHPEVELIHIRKGKGTHIIGDNIDSFEEDDIYIVGKNLPHLWKYESEGTENYSDAVVIHFLAEFWSESFLRIPEMKKVKSFIEQAERGFKIPRGSENGYGKVMEEILEAEGLARVIKLLDLLNSFSLTDERLPLASIGFSHSYDKVDAERLNNIYQYVLANYQQEISLSDISDIANVSVNSFCRYFKSKTNKTFSSFLLEVRIGHACKLLLNSDLNVFQVCYESGFNNLSNFNRYFKQFTGKTPSQYQKAGE
ncbi:AraC-type DNA-binding protein [Spirosomataceae bacterium TFI 002]|nr:AraC-type DNA-binding protein [Spirosomataceae bacterium TFI 002]